MFAALSLHGEGTGTSRPPAPLPDRSYSMNVVTCRAAQVKWDSSACASIATSPREWGLGQARTLPSFSPPDIITDLSPILRPGTSADTGFVVRLEHSVTYCADRNRPPRLTTAVECPAFPQLSQASSPGEPSVLRHRKTPRLCSQKQPSPKTWGRAQASTAASHFTAP